MSSPVDMDLRNIIIVYYLWCKRKNELNKGKRKIRPRPRRFWVRPIFLQRNELGAGKRLLMEMRSNPDNRHCNFLRMSVPTFDRLLTLVGPHISKSDMGREPISTQTRLAVTVRYLASGDSMTSLSYLFRVGISTISNIIAETLNAIWFVLQPIVLKAPDEEGWKKIADGYERRWNFPNCIGAIDGKHVTMQAPPHSGSTYFNYKGSHSLILMAVVDHEYQFTLVDIGAQGRQSDGGIFRNSLIGKKLTNNTLSLPSPRAISDGRPPLPFVIVGDEAFPLSENLLRPYPGKTNYNIESRIYNYRHSRARRMSENAFGILVAQWRIYSHNIIGKTENIENIIKATVCLHNFLIQFEKSSYVPPTLVDTEVGGTIVPGTWREVSSQLTDVGQTGTNMYARSARYIRDTFREYFNEEGAVPWQWDNT